MQASPALEPDAGRDHLDRLASSASKLGFEIVEISGIFDGIDSDSRTQLTSLKALKEGAKRVLDANQGVAVLAGEVQAQAEGAGETLATLLSEVTGNEPIVLELLGWVSGLEGRIGQVAGMLAEVSKSNTLVGSIAKQVNILAINAKIEAARAGDAGRGFAVVAEEVNELSRRTARAAEQISGQVAALDSWIGQLSSETGTQGKTVQKVHDGTTRTGGAVEKVRDAIAETLRKSGEIAQAADAVQRAGDSFVPSFARIDEGAADTAMRTAGARARLEALVETSEDMVQATVAAGGASEDQFFIDRVTADAAALSLRLENAVASGQITEAELFDQTYTPIPGTDPEQVMAPCTDLTDRLFPDIQEAALTIDKRVVFCAAVDTKGYLPTHNRKFSQPQGKDPVWNTANCRNRRIFDDRVGAKAGRNTSPFLLQVYRRDMGGGEFRMMKDLSSPIYVNGRHWGGLRLAYLI